MCKESDPERAEKYRQRARDFVLDFIYYFADDGESVVPSTLPRSAFSPAPPSSSIAF